jgi:hypothetical protein
MGTAADHRLTRRLHAFLRSTQRDYSAGSERPLGGYLTAMTGFGVYTAAWATAVRLSGRPRYVGPQGPAELHEEARTGNGTHSVGELVTCPFCTSVWLVSTLTAGQLLWPRATRTAMGALAALAGADALQLGYAALVDKIDSE